MKNQSIAVRLLCVIFFAAICIYPARLSANATVGHDSLPVKSDSREQLFAVDDATIGRSPQIVGFVSRLDSLNKNGQLRSIVIRGAASPDGPVEHNRHLALMRARAMSDLITTSTTISESQISLNPLGEDWQMVSRLLPGYFSAEECAMMEPCMSVDVYVDTRERNLKQLEGGRLWRRLLDEVFPQVRRTELELTFVDGHKLQLCFDSAGKAEISGEAVEEVESQSVESAEVQVVEEEVIELQEQTPDRYHWYLKTNLAAWCMLVSNIEAEIDVAKHISVVLPVYYSGWNYFKRTIKFRTLTVLPELRWWPKADNQGFFANIHAGFSFYNYALDGDTRYQDHGAKTPAWGGGVGIGYRLQPRGGSPWQFEFSAGAGVYRLDYDTFRNVTNGALTGRHKRTFYGVDNIGVSISYRFDLHRVRTY